MYFGRKTFGRPTFGRQVVVTAFDQSNNNLPNYQVTNITVTTKLQSHDYVCLCNRLSFVGQMFVDPVPLEQVFDGKWLVEKYWADFC